jgi:hypothetical protein
MAVWLETVDVSEHFRDYDENNFGETRGGVVSALRASEWYKEYQEEPLEPSLRICVKYLEEAEDPSDFDYWWGHLYELADRDRIWIETQGY